MRCLMVIVGSLLLSAHIALAAPVIHQGLPPLSSQGVRVSDLMTPEVHEGVIMDVRGVGTFIMREHVYLILRESEVNGTPADQAKFSLKRGDTLKATVYRLPNKAYFVSDLEIK